jgi:hypothetical protein
MAIQPSLSRSCAVRRSTAGEYFFCVLTASFFIAGCTVTSTDPVYQAPQLGMPANLPKTVAIAPPEVQVTRQSFGAVHENLPEVEASVSGDLTSLIAAQMTQRGFDAKSGQFGGQDAPAIRHAYGQLSQAVLTQQFTLGKGAMPLSERSATSYVIFVWFHGFTRSGGDKAGEFAKAFAVGLLTAGVFVPERKPSGGADLDVALVRGSDGDVLWWQHAHSLKTSLASPDFDQQELADEVQEVFAKYPSQ